MARLIDADALLNDNTWEWFDDYGNYTVAGAAIAEAPTVDSAPVVHGEWIETEYHTWECGICGFHPFKAYIPKNPGFNYCPNCGANMRGDEVANN